MTQSKHTPAPWLPPVETAVQFGFPRWDILAKDGDTVTYVARAMPVGNSKKERQANAHLIAAAPELLLRLEKSLELWYTMPKSDAVKHQIKEIEKEIVKAKGKNNDTK